MLTSFAGLGLALVGCSHFMARQHPPEPPSAPAAVKPAWQEPIVLTPGVGRVTVGRVARNGATIWWKSGWKGQSAVIYGRDPHFSPMLVERSVPTGDNMMVLADLTPGTRYYFQVETATAKGVARSAVLSFRTTDQPLIDRIDVPPPAGSAPDPVPILARAPKPHPAKVVHHVVSHRHGRSPSRTRAH